MQLAGVVGNACLNLWSILAEMYHFEVCRQLLHNSTMFYLSQSMTAMIRLSRGFCRAYSLRSVPGRQVGFVCQRMKAWQFHGRNSSHLCLCIVRINL